MRRALRISGILAPYMENIPQQRPDYDEDPSVGNALENATERNERRMNDLEKRATTDPLTGLLNRGEFERRVDEMVQRFKGRRESDVGASRVSVLMIDIDHFKSVNDTHGHPVGDEVIVSLARILRNHVRTTDCVARLGGEEFAVGFENADGKTFEKAEQIRKDVESSIVLPDGKHVTISIGIAETTGFRNVARLYKRADEALYEAKEGGRNRIVIAGPLEE